MTEQRSLPKRKHPRLDSFDYSSCGAYFITICTQGKRCILSNIVPSTAEDDAHAEYTTFGKIAEKQLLLLEERYPILTVDQFVIMPNHIHIILLLGGDAAGASPRPTVMDIVCTFKSLTALACKRAGFEGKLFQTSFYEHIIRNASDYDETAKYIYQNPANWQKDNLFAE